MLREESGVQLATVPAGAARSRGSRAEAMAFNHAGLSVTDLDEAIEWYGTVFGLRLLFGPFTIDGDTVPSDAPADTFGPEWRQMRIAHMVASNGVGMELFEFCDPPAERRTNNFEYWKTGIFHICFTCPDVAETVDRITSHGGRLRTRVHEVAPGSYFCYCEDPFGNIVELVNHSYEVLFTPPPPPPALPPANDGASERVAEYARQHIGQQVGQGECSDLASAALHAAGARPGRPARESRFDWGTQIPLSHAGVGDILQFRNHRVVVRAAGAAQARVEHRGRPHHTAVVIEVIGPGVVLVAEQPAVRPATHPVNVATVFLCTQRWQGDQVTVGGEAWAFRPENQACAM
jgi:catechol 2,3-dioxygenase-like lactoylglutathione lyase family enzyme